MTFCVNGIQIVLQAVQNYLVLLMADIKQSCQMPWNCVITVVLWIHWSKVEFCLHLIRFAQLEKIKNSHSCINHIVKHLIHFMRPCYMHLLFLFVFFKFWNLTNTCSLFQDRLCLKMLIWRTNTAWYPDYNQNLCSGARSAVCVCSTGSLCNYLGQHMQRLLPLFHQCGAND